MQEEDTKDSDVFPLSKEQKDKAVEDLHKRGATFFKWEQLQRWIRIFGSKATIEEIKNKVLRLREKKDQESKD